MPSKELLALQTQIERELNWSALDPSTKEILKKLFLLVAQFAEDQAQK